MRLCIAAAILILAALAGCNVTGEVNGDLDTNGTRITFGVGVRPATAPPAAE